MKAKLEIEFKKIGRFMVTKKLIEKNPKLMGSTEKTVEVLCEQIEKYFKDKKIRVKTKFELIENDKG